MIRPEYSYGCDISEEFVKICSEKGLRCRLGDILDIPYSNNSFDATLCIAVLHHLDTKDKMIRGIQELLRVTKIGGRILITVWAYE
jgi:SAM-dependent methyltransferase